MARKKAKKKLPKLVLKLSMTSFYRFKANTKQRCSYFRKSSKVLKSSDINKFPLNKDERKSWLEFKNFYSGTRVLCMINSELVYKAQKRIYLDHPFVPVIANYAIAAINMLCKMHVKKKKSNNLCHHEVMDCKFIKFPNTYFFYMTIEAIEEGILGVYESIVACNLSNGSRTLIEFKLVDSKPVGRIAMALPYLIRLKSRYRTLKGMEEGVGMNLERTQRSMKSVKGKNKLKLKDELGRLKEQHKAIKDTCNVLYWRLRSQIPKTWNQRSRNPDDWCVPEYSISGFEKRNDNATCKGYDYTTLSSEFPMYGRI